MQVNKINFSYTQKPSFKSHRAHEQALAELKRQSELAQERKVCIQRLANYELQEPYCDDMSQFLLNFVCSIENESEHSLDEFFDSEFEASKQRAKLSPECQKRSLEIREAIQSQPVVKDAVFTLITANNMKDYEPQDKEFVQMEEYKKTVDSVKKTLVKIVKNSDTTKFDEKEKGLIQKLTDMISSSAGLNFGEEYEETLKTLLNSLKSKQQTKDRILAQQKLLDPKIIAKKIKLK
jgi:hypothetical protein